MTTKLNEALTVRTINVTMSDEMFRKLRDKKGQTTWREYIGTLIEAGFNTTESNNVNQVNELHSTDIIQQ